MRSITLKIIDKVNYILEGSFFINDTVKTIIQKDIINRKKSMGVIYGEFGNSDTYDISLAKVSHIIEDVKFRNNKAFITCRVLNTRKGKELKELIDDGLCGALSMYIKYHKSKDQIKKIFSVDIDITDDRKSEEEILREERREKLNIINGL